MTDGNTASFLEPIDRNAMLRFGRWMSAGSDAHRVEVFTKIADGDQWMGLALAALCDMELCAALDEVKSEAQEHRQWFWLSDITEYVEKMGDDEHFSKYLVGAFADLAGAGLAMIRTENLAYRGGYVGANIGFSVYWPNVLDYWDHALKALFRPDGYVYILGAPDYYKIGRAKDVDARARQLAIQLPWAVDIVHAIPCEDYATAERALHRRFADRRANGEWFLLGAGDVEYLKGIRRMRGADVERGENGE